MLRIAIYCGFDLYEKIMSFSKRKAFQYRVSVETFLCIDAKALLGLFSKFICVCASCTCLRRVSGSGKSSF